MFVVILPLLVAAHFTLTTELSNRDFNFSIKFKQVLILQKYAMSAVGSWSYGIAKDQRHIGEYAAISENTKY